jgi:hypothetical protein
MPTRDLEGLAMTNAIGTNQDPALQPAAAAAKQVDVAAEATRKAHAEHESAGRLAVDLIEKAAKVSDVNAEPARQDDTRGSLVDKRA